MGVRSVLPVLVRGLETYDYLVIFFDVLSGLIVLDLFVSEEPLPDELLSTL